MIPRVLAPLAALALLVGCQGSSGPGPRRTPSPRVVTTTEPPGIPSSTPSAAPKPPYTLVSLGTFSSPVWAGAVPGDPGSVYLVEKTGRVRHLDTDGRPLGIVLDLTKQVSHGNEQGLLSIAFDPAYPANHRMYADFTDKNGDTKVVAYTVTADSAGSGQELLTVDHPFPNHNGGLLLFDASGSLLVGLGDGGSAGDPGNTAQDLRSDLGKILRLNPRTGAGATGNPYRQNPKVWALGLRNPLRFSFDTNGDLYLGDVGQNKVEELDVVPPALQRGANYGWSVYEGNERFKKDQEFTPGGPLIVPALTYPHSEGGCSITGGVVYRGAAIPDLDGDYLFGDFCEGKLLRTRRTSTGVSPSVELGLTVQGLAAFGVDRNGELLVMSADKLFRLVPDPQTGSGPSG